MFESTNYAEIPILLQIHEIKGGDVHNNSNNKLTSSDSDEISTRWKEICQKIQVDPNLDKEKKQQLWKVLKCYQDVFAWNKGEFSCYTLENMMWIHKGSHLTRYLLVNCPIRRRQK